jgi:hypothetical protein
MAGKACEDQSHGHGFVGLTSSPGIVFQHRRSYAAIAALCDFEPNCCHAPGLTWRRWAVGGRVIMSWFEEWRCWLGGWHRWFGGWRRESTALVDITITIGHDQITVDVDGERAFRCELINLTASQIPAARVSCHW